MTQHQLSESLSSEEKNRYIVEQVLQTNTPMCNGSTDSIGCKQCGSPVHASPHPELLWYEGRSDQATALAKYILTTWSLEDLRALGERLDYFAPHLQFVDAVIDIHQGKQKSTGEKHP